MSSIYLAVGGHASSLCRVSGGVGFVVRACLGEPTPAFGHPSKEGMGKDKKSGRGRNLCRLV